MFMALTTLRMIKPGPASRLLVRGILGERLLLRKETESESQTGLATYFADNMTYAYSECTPFTDDCRPAVNGGIFFGRRLEAR
jgi:hypothetical protein